MQATATGARFSFGRFKYAIAALGVVGALAIAVVVVSAIGHDGSGGAASRQTTGTNPSAARGLRWAEINMLPEASSLPVDAAASTTTGYARMRYLEMNDAMFGAGSAAAPDFRTLEMNSLPGDDVGDVAPYTDQVGVRH